MSDHRSLLRSAGAISLATMVSRVLGLLRDQVQAYFFGAGLVADAFLAAFRIPNLLRDLFAEGALSSAFVPTFTAERERAGADSAFALANRVMTALALVLGVLAVLIAVFAPQILRVYVPGFEPSKMALAVTMTRILAPFLFFVALAAVAMGVLNTCGRFFLPALAPAWFNLAAIFGVLALVPLFRRLGIHPGLSLAVGAMAGGVLQFLVQVPAMRREGFRFRPELAPRDPGLNRVVRLMAPATFGLAATQINILVDTILASLYGNGPIAWLSYAFRLMQLPLGLFGVALGTANLARVSKDAARGDASGLRANLAGALRAAALLTLPATAGLVALRVPIVRLLFQHGRFGPADTLKTASAVLCYGLGLYAYSVTKIQVPTFYALGETRRPVIASASAVGLKISANLVLMALLPRIGIDPFLGLALSTSLAAWSNMVILERGLARRAGALREHAVVPTTLKLALLSAVMGIACGLCQAGLERFAGGGGVAGEAARLGGSVALGIGLTAWGAHALRLPEVEAIRARVLGRVVGGDKRL
ncbi:MAG: murein biosynthesis integral membrane protein MurJ [Acidobacteriia bacterium]|nr:murein biosynthesis integral membrane protein MurJ [Terriglobia bacterium]